MAEGGGRDMGQVLKKNGGLRHAKSARGMAVSLLDVIKRLIQRSCYLLVAN